MKLLIVAVCLVAAVSAFHNDFMRVKLNHGGGVVGKYMQTNNGRGVIAFTGIPYAETPIGDLRFNDPVTKSGWNGYRDGRNFENVVCPQYTTWNKDKNSYFGQEDCLYMNVYVPMNVKNNKYDMKNLPVMFYIHGGGYTMGNGNRKFTGPEYLLDHDVILVTGNYRLGPFGFLTLDNDRYNGNYGMKDQRMMLKWVQDNIQNFGGDRTKVTVFGDGAGAASIGLHMMSPNSKGLFHQAILQGGTQYNQWAVQDKHLAVRNAMRMLNMIGCNKDNNMNDMDEIRRCLREKHVYDIMRATQNLYEFHNDPMVVFGPVVETNGFTNFKNNDNNRNNNNNNHGNFFLTEDIYTNKNYWGNDIKVIVGLNNDAGAFKYVTLMNDQNQYHHFVNNMDNMLPVMFNYQHLDNQNKQKVNNMIRDFYFKNKDFNNKNDIQQNFINLVTDGWFLSGVDEFLNNRFNNNQKNNGNTFVFLFNYRGDASFTDYIFRHMNKNGDLMHHYKNFNDHGLTDNDYHNMFNFGVCNNDNMLYTFPMTKNVINHRVMTQNDFRMRDIYTKMMTHFAINGTPNTEDFKWTQATKYPVDYFRFGNYNRDNWMNNRMNFNNNNDMLTCGMKNGFFEDRTNLWRQINQIRNHNNQNFNKFMKNEL